MDSQAGLARRMVRTCLIPMQNESYAACTGDHIVVASHSLWEMDFLVRCSVHAIFTHFHAVATQGEYSRRCSPRSRRISPSSRPKSSSEHQARNSSIYMGTFVGVCHYDGVSGIRRCVGVPLSTSSGLRMVVVFYSHSPCVPPDSIVNYLMNAVQSCKFELDVQLLDLHG
jgi:hypothetical protein